MPTLERDLLLLIRDNEITHKDAANIILVRDGLKPFSSVGVSFSRKLVDILKKHGIPFVERNSRVYTGRLGSSCKECKLHKTSNCCGERTDDGSVKYCQVASKNGINFGFPHCCSSFFPSNPVFSKKSRNSFSPGMIPYIFHIPCSEKCENTINLAGKYKEHIKNNYPSIAKTIEASAL